MNVASGSVRARATSAAIDEVARRLPQQTARLSRLLVRLTGGPLSRSEATVLSTLADGPRRITELAEIEGLAQPTITALVKRLEVDGLVVRRPDQTDGRAVLVTLTKGGAASLEDLRERYRDTLRGHLSSVEAEQVQALLSAAGALEELVEALQRGVER